jgi:hypothetical protein
MYFKRETWLINSIKTIIKIKRVKEVIALKTITDCRKKNGSIQQSTCIAG